MNCTDNPYQNITIFNPEYNAYEETGMILSILSTFFVSSFIAMSLILHLCGSARHGFVNRKKLISRWNCILCVLYCISIGLQEVFMIHGQQLGVSIHIYESISLLMVISWVLTNFMSVVMLLIACFSKQGYRILLYIVYVIQMCGCSMVIAERILINSQALDFISPTLMLLISTWIVYSIPPMFQVNYNAITSWDKKGSNYLLVAHKGDSKDKELVYTELSGDIEMESIEPDKKEDKSE
jgi:hypothetical protein